MASRKQRANGFNKFLDLIGLVDSSDNGRRDDDFDTEYSGSRSHGRSGAKNNDFDDEYFDEPRMSRAQQPKRERAAQNQNNAAGNDHFDADEGWNDSSSNRPDYGARNQQRAQTGSRPASARYGGSNQSQNNSRSYARYESSRSGGENGYRRTSYQNEGYQTTSHRAGNSSYSGYSASSRRTEHDKTYHTGTPAQDQVQNAEQRHQTSIFKIRSVDECKGVILALLDKKSVLLNMDELDSLQAQRTLDTMSGATYAIGARLSRASDRTWLITPSTVEVDDGQNDPGNGYGGRFI